MGLGRAEGIGVSVPKAVIWLGWLALLMMQVPLIHTVWVSFSPDMLLTPPVSNWSFRWYAAFMEDPQWSRAAARSLVTGVLASVVAVPAGTMAALGLRGLAGMSRTWAMALLLAPACVPAVALGLGLLQAAHALGVAGGWAVLVFAHALLGLPLVVLLARMGLSARVAELEAAARGLGAGPILVAWRVTLPLIAPWLFAAAVAVFVISLNDAVVAVFVCGPDTETLPVVAWRQLRHAAGPLVAVAGTVTLAISVLACLFMIKRPERRRDAPE